MALGSTMKKVNQGLGECYGAGAASKLSSREPETSYLMWFLSPLEQAWGATAGGMAVPSSRPAVYSQDVFFRLNSTEKLKL